MTLWVCIAVAAMAVWFFADVVHRWLSTKLAERVLKRATNPNYKPGSRRLHSQSIEISDAGFEVQCRTTQGQSWGMEWPQIAKVDVFKRDLFGYDLVCMAVEGCDGAVVELDEEMSGWMEFIENLPDKLPGCLAWHDWFMRVAFPAFETNLETIFERCPRSSAVPIATRS